MPESDPFKITLKENGLHSYWQGIDLYAEYLQSQDKMQLRDAIMFLHHGVELLMKQILVSKSEFLIFTSLNEAAAKQKKADDLGTNIFVLENPPKTITYTEAIARVEAFIKPPQLNDDLTTGLTRLNSIRNQLEHYAIETDLDQSIKLLASLHQPLLDLFEAQIGGVLRTQTRATRRAWRTVQDRADFASRLEAEVADVMTAFAGQTVPGRLFGLDGQLTLPSFSQVLADAALPHARGVGYRPDLVGEGEHTTWIVDVAGTGARLLDRSGRMRAYRNFYVRAPGAQTGPVTLWLVVFADLEDRVRETARDLGILLTTGPQLYELKDLLSVGPESTATSAHPE